MKLCVFIAVCASLLFYNFATVGDPKLENLGAGEYQIYSTQTVKSPLVTKITDMGFAYIYHAKSSDAAHLRKLFTRIDGESIVIKDTDMTASAAVRHLKYSAVSIWKDGNVVSVYAYSVRGKHFITDKQNKINLQVVKSGTTLTAGRPIILGSY